MAYTRINKKCPICSKLTDNRAKICRECYYKTLKGEGNPMFGKKFAKKPQCIDCNKEINYGYQRCHSCAAKYIMKTSKRMIRYLKNRFGKNNPNWIDGRSFEPYTSDFTEELKESIRKRDNYKCQNCGMTEKEHLIVYGSVLHIHHIDYDKTNCQEENLITTCLSCNIRANYNRTYWKQFYQEVIHVS